MPTQAKFTGGWKKLGWMLDPTKGGRHIVRAVDRMTHVNGKILAAEMRRRITAGDYGESAALTATIKGSRDALKGTRAALTFKAIAYTRLDERRGFVGVLRRNARFDVAVTVHQGATVRVTPAMRRMFWALWLRSIGRLGRRQLTGRALEIWDEAARRTRRPQFFPLKESTTALVIPPRRFVQDVIEDRVMLLRLRANWAAAASGAVISKL